MNNNSLLRAWRVVAVFGWLLPGVATAAELTPAEARGKTLYREGLGAGGAEVIAVMGEGNIEVPAAAVPCGSCHGRDGRGRAEGGLVPSDITWVRLSKPYGVTTSTGRKAQTYDDRLLKRAITLGVDSSGNPLNPAMPRYRLTQEDAADLVAYVKRLGTELEPGVEEAVLRVGTLLPNVEGGPGAAVEAALRARFAEINAAGGLFGRRLELLVQHSRERPDLTKAALEDFIDQAKPFVLIAPFLGGAEAELTAVATSREVPFVGAISLAPKESYPAPRYVFYLLPGPTEQARGLLAHAAQPGPGQPEGVVPRWALLVPSGNDSAGELAGALEQQAARSRRPAPPRIMYGAGAHDGARIVARLIEEKLDTLFLLGDAGETAKLLADANDAGWTGRVYLASAEAARIVTSNAGVVLGNKTFFALPLLPGGAVGEDLSEFRRFAAANRLPAGHEAVQRIAVASVRLLSDALVKLGRDVTRERLVDEIEKHYQLDTGVLPPLTFGPNRRIGAQGAYVLSADAKGRIEPVSGWVNAD